MLNPDSQPSHEPVSSASEYRLVRVLAFSSHISVCFDLLELIITVMKRLVIGGLFKVSLLQQS